MARGLQLSGITHKERQMNETDRSATISTITTAEELALVLDSPSQYRMSGPVLLRRRLHPFSEAYIQVITEVYMESATWRHHVAVILAVFIGGNGASIASREWAEPLFGVLPSGVVITDVGAQWTPQIRRGLAWIFQNTGDELRADTEKISACGSDFWQQATWEMDRVREHLAARSGPEEREPSLPISKGPTAPVFAVSTDDTEGMPGVATLNDLFGYTEPPTFTEWWERIATVEYQRALHTQLTSAWHGAIGDFDAWWKLFGVGE
jgi:hypothetical protein